MRNVADAELVVGIVGRMGVNTSAVEKWITEVLHSLHYQSHPIKITNFLETKDFGFDLKQNPIEDRYETHINACNQIRQKAGRNDFFASYAIQEIINARQQLNENENAGVPAPRTAYIVNQIKRLEEAEAFRSVYGRQFILISCHIPTEARRETLAHRIAEEHADKPKAAKWQAVVNRPQFSGGCLV
jgi:cytidine deaminase